MKLLIPEFDIEDAIGDGAMATVYLATQRSLERKVALKVMAAALAADPSFCERFLREGKTLARLSHPHIVTIHDIGHAGDLYFMAMEYLPNGTLKERIAAGVSVDQGVAYIRQIASALGYAHAKGLVHRDVKPANILFRADGVAVLSDFGIAKSLDERTQFTQAGFAIGTPSYMSPEQARGMDLDGRADLYALGVILYQVLTGKLPYGGTDALSTALAHLTEPLPALPVYHGRYQGNPVGLFDVIGNAAEMVQESFQLVRAGRRQGAYGGFIAKGGNYLEGEGTLFTGMRREYPLFAADGTEQRNEATGFRVAIGALSAPRSRYKELFEQWHKEGRLSTLTDAIDGAQDPTSQLDSIIASSSDPRLQGELGQVNEAFKHSLSLIARQREEAAGNLIQSSALVAETISNYNIRLINLKNSQQQARQGNDQASAELFAIAIENGRRALDGAVEIYIDNLATGTRYTDAVIQAQLQQVKQALSRKPVLGKSLMARATLFVRHVGDYRQKMRADPAKTLKQVLAAASQP